MSPSSKTAKAPSNSTRKQQRNHNSFTTNQRYRKSQRSTSFATTEKVSTINAPQTMATATKHQNMFDDILRLNGYPEGTINKTKHSQNHQKDPRPLNTEWPCLKMPHVSERLNYKITNIFRKEGIPVRVTHKSYTLRRALSQNNTERTCTRANCPISNTNLCLLRNVVYQITCNNCIQHYIGSTTRFVHDRVREHLIKQ